MNSSFNVLPQQQIGFKQSRKLCLDLWSLKWLKPNLSLVNSFISIGLWQVKVLLGVGRMNCTMVFLRTAKLSEVLILSPWLFHSITVDGKNEFLKKVCLTFNLRILSILFLVLYAVLVVWILSKRYLGDWFLAILKKQQSSQKHRRCFKDSKPNPW